MPFEEYHKWGLALDGRLLDCFENAAMIAVSTWNAAGMKPHANIDNMLGRQRETPKQSSQDACFQLDSYLSAKGIRR